jgi:hypothetical protein
MRTYMGSWIVMIGLVFTAFAQHQNSSNTPTAPPPAPSPAPAPVVHSAPPPAAPSMTSAPSMSPSHSFTPSAPAATGAPAVHTAPAGSSSVNLVREAAPVRSISNGVENVPRAKDPVVAPTPKLTAPVQGTQDRRIGEAPAGKERRGNPVESDLRQRLCEGGPCKETAPKSQPPVSDSLRHCLTGAECKCPAGQTAGKGGCVAAAAVTQAQTQCGAGMVWNGSACATSTACPIGETWNGVNCVPVSCPAGQIRIGVSCQQDCSGSVAQAESVIPEVRSARLDRDRACMANPSSKLCQDLDLRYQSEMVLYRNLWAGAPSECRTTLPIAETI